jgi:hypothetical protein
MYRFPLPSTATPTGVDKCELVAAPGVGVPLTPLPATIDSVPPGVTFSTTWLFASAI